jgi:quinolinate synthase
MDVQSELEIKAQIRALKVEKKAIILAHYYQVPEIQDLADFVGDSLGLSVQAAETDAEIIVFAGVHFMAETAKILNPGKRVVLPDLNAGCSLAESCSVADFSAFRAKHPDHIAITYINCSAEVKACSDIICTSSNALQIIESFPPGQPLIFAPDRNLGRWLMEKTGRTLLLWDGACSVHEAFSINKLMDLKMRYPDAALVVHPEAQMSLIELADFVGSTAAMLKFVAADSRQIFIIATEAGILHKMSACITGKTLIAAPAYADNACACSECPYMKMNTLEKLHQAILSGGPEITLSEDLLKNALRPLQRMLEFTN